MQKEIGPNLDNRLNGEFEVIEFFCPSVPSLN